MDWLMSPLSGAATHSIAPWAAWHARLMVLGWGLLLPLGALVARFYKVVPTQDWPRVLDHKAWWHAHRALQWAGISAMTLGLWMVWGRASGAAPLHAALGWALCIAGWLGGVIICASLAQDVSRASPGLFFNEWRFK